MFEEVHCYIGKRWFKLFLHVVTKLVHVFLRAWIKFILQLWSFNSGKWRSVWFIEHVLLILSCFKLRLWTDFLSIFFYSHCNRIVYKFSVIILFFTVEVACSPRGHKAALSFIQNVIWRESLRLLLLVEVCLLVLNHCFSGRPVIIGAHIGVHSFWD